MKSEDAKSSESLEITITDSLGNYDDEEVNIQLISDIPGYEIASYSAKKSQDSEDYYISIEIPECPEDTESCKIAVAIIPKDGYIEEDWSGNSWSSSSEETISVSSDLSKSSDDRALSGFIFGNFAL